jgi:polyisoprenoid-binding protein YceI
MNAVRFLAVVLSLAAFSSPVLAADWATDAGKSQLKFTGVQAGAPFSGKFGHWEAQISFDPANPAGGHALVIIDTASAATGDPQKDEALPQSDWFDAKAFPQARFEAKSFKPLGSDHFEAAGSLTIKGVSKNVILPFILQISGDKAHMLGHLDIERTDYHVGEGAWTATTFVAGTVGIDIDLTAVKK